jgi:hypothetical protein
MSSITTSFFLFSAKDVIVEENGGYSLLVRETYTITKQYLCFNRRVGSCRVLAVLAGVTNATGAV